MCLFPWLLITIKSLSIWCPIAEKSWVDTTQKHSQEVALREKVASILTPMWTPWITDPSGQHKTLWQQARQGSTLDICNLERSFPVGTAARVTSSRLYNSEISFKGHRSMCTVNCVWRMEWWKALSKYQRSLGNKEALSPAVCSLPQQRRK